MFYKDGNAFGLHISDCCLVICMGVMYDLYRNLQVANILCRLSLPHFLPNLERLERV